MHFLQTDFKCSASNLLLNLLYISPQTSFQNNAPVLLSTFASGVCLFHTTCIDLIGQTYVIWEPFITNATWGTADVLGQLCWAPQVQHPMHQNTAVLGPSGPASNTPEHSCVGPLKSSIQYTRTQPCWAPKVQHPIHQNTAVFFPSGPASNTPEHAVLGP